jgi:tRNA A37 threonylcarbamoyladenosine synthetase subunit TsaC/SUA5/YrdC
MASNAKKTKRIRARKAKPNRKNLKVNVERLQENTKILRSLADRDKD